MRPDQLYALRSPLDTFDPAKIVQRARRRRLPDGSLLVVVLAVERLNDGLPMWHASVSMSGPRGVGRLDRPDVAEAEAVRACRGVGGEHEWWFYNQAASVGHLRVPITAAEALLVPGGVVTMDAGESGPLRPRSR